MASGCSQAGGGSQELLWQRSGVVGSLGDDDVLGLCDAHPLEDQSARVASLVFRSMWGEGR